MIDLEQSLEELAERLEVPGDGWLVADVVRRIGEPVHATPSRRAPRLAGALIAVIVIAVVLLPGPRRALGRWLGFDSVRIEPGVTVPTEAPPPTTGPVATVPAGSGPAPTTTAEVPSIASALDLGPSMSMVQAMSFTGLPNPAPTLLGTPASVHVVQPPATGQIVLVYAPSDLLPQSEVTGVGALVSAIPMQIDEGLFGKTLGNTSTVRTVQVGDVDGFWIEGSPHQMFFKVGDDIRPDTLRLATNTLLWQHEGYVYRLEADISLETALRIALSVP